MRIAALVLSVAYIATAAAQAQASGSCREYTLFDNDTGERVEGCVPLLADSTNKKPVQVVPAMKKRTRFGWKIAELSRGDMLARMGLRPGDVILTFNGYDMASQETPNVIAEVLGGHDKLVLTVGKKPRPQQASPKPGKTVMQVTKSTAGIKLETIPEGSFFETIGLQPGDTVLSIAGSKISDIDKLNYLVKEAERMAEVHVIIRRNGQEMDLLIKSE